eukprot:gene23877-30155_t
MKFLMFESHHFAQLQHFTVINKNDNDEDSSTPQMGYNAFYFMFSRHWNHLQSVTIDGVTFYGHKKLLIVRDPQALFLLHALAKEWQREKVSEKMLVESVVLSGVDLSGATLAAEGLNALKSQFGPTLQQLDFEPSTTKSRSVVSDAREHRALLDLIMCFPSLRVLRMRNIDLPVIYFETLFRFLSQLDSLHSPSVRLQLDETFLSLTGVPDLTEAVAVKLGHNKVMLDRVLALRLMHCHVLTDTMLSSLVTGGLRHMMHLRIEDCLVVSSVGVSAVLKQCASLSLLHLVNCPNLVGSVLAAQIAKYGRNLTLLKWTCSVALPAATVVTTVTTKGGGVGAVSAINTTHTAAAGGDENAPPVTNQVNRNVQALASKTTHLQQSVVVPQKTSSPRHLPSEDSLLQIAAYCRKLEQVQLPVRAVSDAVFKSFLTYCDKLIFLGSEQVSYAVSADVEDVRLSRKRVKCCSNLSGREEVNEMVVTFNYV